MLPTVTFLKELIMPRKIKKKSYHHGDLENSLVKTTLKLLQNNSSSELSLRQIARASGVSHSAVYRHFQDKEALFNRIAAIGFDRLAVYQSKAASHGSSNFDSFRRAGLAYIKFSLRFPGWYQLMFQRRNIQPDLTLRRAMIRSYSVLLHLSEKFVKDRKINQDPKDYAMYAWSVVHGFSSLAIESDFPKMNARNSQQTVIGLSEKVLSIMELS